MLSSSVTKAHVRAAVKEIELDGVPRQRRSTKFFIQFGTRHYPPKYVLALAVRNATGKLLLPSEHSGGAETKRRLAALGFDSIIPCSCGGLTANRDPKNRAQ